MIFHEHYGPAAEAKPRAYLVSCRYCGDRVRLDVVNVNCVVCNCVKGTHNALKITAIKGRVTAHVCNAKCVSSKSGVCDCSCGGKNHGKAWV